jgi:hypothetical protein
MQQTLIVHSNADELLMRRITAFGTDMDKIKAQIDKKNIEWEQNNKIDEQL